VEVGAVAVNLNGEDAGISCELTRMVKVLNETATIAHKIQHMHKDKIQVRHCDTLHTLTG
jgi:hypothetical protein